MRLGLARDWYNASASETYHFNPHAARPNIPSSHNRWVGKNEALNPSIQT